MKRLTKKLTKMQRKAESKRKTWTNAERFLHRNERAMKEQANFAKAMKRFSKQFANIPAPEMPATEEPTKEPEVIEAEFAVDEQ